MFAACLALKVGGFPAAYAAPLVRDIQVQPTSVKLSWEHLTLPESERLGLAGAEYLWLLPGEWQFGLAAFGAITGERGGFFTGGFELTKSRELGRGTAVGGGVFVGGGGGGSAPQGGGLMLRPHLDLTYRVSKDLLVGIGAAHVSFPNGAISSTQATLLLEHRYDVFTIRPGFPTDIGSMVEGLGLAEREIGFDFKNYYPRPHLYSTSGERFDQPLNLLGVKGRQYLDSDTYILLSTHGALGGGADGYAEVLVGAGKRRALARGIELQGEISVGAGGGGAVRVGGGGMMGAEGGLQYRVSPAWSLAAHVGRIMAPDGRFASNIVGASLNYRYQALVRGGENPLTNSTILAEHRWAVRGGAYRYLPASGSQRKGGTVDERPIDLVSAGVELWWSDNAYVLGQAYSAIDADAGGYSVGLVGLGARLLEVTPDWHFGAELAAGAAGGGGIAVGTGIVVQPSVFLAFAPADGVQFRLYGGGLVPPSGTFRAGVVGIQLVHAFSSPYRGLDW